MSKTLEFERYNKKKDMGDEDYNFCVGDVFHLSSKDSKDFDIIYINLPGKEEFEEAIVDFIKEHNDCIVLVRLPREPKYQEINFENFYVEAGFVYSNNQIGHYDDLFTILLANEIAKEVLPEEVFDHYLNVPIYLDPAVINALADPGEIS